MGCVSGATSESNSWKSITFNVPGCVQWMNKINRWLLHPTMIWRIDYKADGLEHRSSIHLRLLRSLNVSKKIKYQTISLLIIYSKLSCFYSSMYLFTYSLLCYLVFYLQDSLVGGPQTCSAIKHTLLCPKHKVVVINLTSNCHTSASFQTYDLNDELWIIIFSMLPGSDKLI